VTRPLTLLQHVRQVKSQNTLLTEQLRKMTKSRDLWREKAKARRMENKVLRRQPQRRPRPPRTYSVEQWRQHALIVERIRSIPNREL
jgi:hypothetical protein